MKLIKFDLPINGTKVKTLEELRDNLTDEILALARSSQLEHSSQLERWLRTRQLPDQAQAVAEAVKREGTDKGLFLALCKVLDVEAHPDDVKAIFDAPPAPGNSIHKARYFEMYEALKNRFEKEQVINKRIKSAVAHHADREKLFSSFQLLQSRFSIVLEQEKIHKNYFNVFFQNFMLRISNNLTLVLEKYQGGKKYDSYMIKLVDLINSFRDDLDKRLAELEQALRFQDSLLVFITGKVKSGKSSLGNYMAWGYTDPDEELKQQVTPHQVPIYFSHENNAVDGGDAKDEAEQWREFGIGPTESIQGFKLPGLTWVDSPGLHSFKEKNEKLARDYVEHADLILYTMKSDAPGRASDLAEIQQLLGKDKKVLLLLTGSDDVEEDYDDETDSLVQTVVMKDANRREKQHAYVREALRELANGSSDSRIANLEIVSISARYAQLNADDPAAFSESGMGLLYQILHRIAQSDSVRIKQRAPIENMCKFMSSCCDDLIYFRELLSKFFRQSRDLTESIWLSSMHESLMLEISEFENKLRQMLQVARSS
ncbi:hypothetical protein C6P61_00345 [Malikia spinosa]|uniref:Dynamin N-terminal domain-containing protein n=1 Tax=Malikia spinosa TaxID=86180 RepID=A0A2S9KJE6_9BURK|nr:dynamin family protein [Malikia spinosa]PRD70569.1 hypothetical protein C6P61_00345 [Malikia spinosa]